MTTNNAPALADALRNAVERYAPLQQHSPHHLWLVDQLQAGGALMVGNALVMPDGVPATIYAQDTLLCSPEFLDRVRLEASRKQPFAPANISATEAAKRREVARRAPTDRLRKANGEGE